MNPSSPSASIPRKKKSKQADQPASTDIPMHHQRSVSLNGGEIRQTNGYGVSMGVGGGLRPMVGTFPMAPHVTQVARTGTPVGRTIAPGMLSMSVIPPSMYGIPARPMMAPPASTAASLIPIPPPPHMLPYPPPPMEPTVRPAAMKFTSFEILTIGEWHRVRSYHHDLRIEFHLQPPPPIPTPPPANQSPNVLSYVLQNGLAHFRLEMPVCTISGFGIKDLEGSSGFVMHIVNAWKTEESGKGEKPVPIELEVKFKHGKKIQTNAGVEVSGGGFISTTQTLAKFQFFRDNPVVQGVAGDKVKREEGGIKWFPCTDFTERHQASAISRHALIFRDENMLNEFMEGVGKVDKVVAKLWRAALKKRKQQLEGGENAAKNESVQTGSGEKHDQEMMNEGEDKEPAVKRRKSNASAHVDLSTTSTATKPSRARKNSTASKAPHASNIVHDVSSALRTSMSPSLLTSTIAENSATITNASSSVKGDGSMLSVPNSVPVIPLIMPRRSASMPITPNGVPYLPPNYGMLGAAPFPNAFPGDMPFPENDDIHTTILGQSMLLSEQHRFFMDPSLSRHTTDSPVDPNMPAMAWSNVSNYIYFPGVSRHSDIGSHTTLSNGVSRDVSVGISEVGGGMGDVEQVLKEDDEEFPEGFDPSDVMCMDVISQGDEDAKEMEVVSEASTLIKEAVTDDLAVTSSMESSRADSIRKNPFEHPRYPSSGVPTTPKITIPKLMRTRNDVTFHSTLPRRHSVSVGTGAYTKPSFADFFGTNVDALRVVQHVPKQDEEDEEDSTGFDMMEDENDDVLGSFAALTHRNLGVGKRRASMSLADAKLVDYGPPSAGVDLGQGTTGNDFFMF